MCWLQSEWAGCKESVFLMGTSVLCIDIVSQSGEIGVQGIGISVQGIRSSVHGIETSVQAIETSVQGIEASVLGIGANALVIKTGVHSIHGVVWGNRRWCPVHRH